MADSSIQIPMFLPEKKKRGRNLELVGERSVEPIQTPPPAVEMPSESPASRSLADREMALMRKESDLRQAAVTISTGLRALGQRVMTLLALIASGGMFYWAVLEPTTARIVAACLFSVLVFLPLAWIDARRE